MSEDYDDDDFLEEEVVQVVRHAPPKAPQRQPQQPLQESPYSSRSSTPRSDGSSRSRSGSGSRSPSPTSSPAYARSDNRARDDGTSRRPPNLTQAAPVASSRGSAAPALHQSHSTTRIVASKNPSAVVRRENSDDIEILVGRPSQVKSQSNQSSSGNVVAAGRGPSNAKSSPRRSVQADVLDEDDDDESLVDTSPRKMPSSKAAPALVALAARQAPVRQSVVTKSTGGAAHNTPPAAGRVVHHHPAPPPPAPRPPPPQPVMREVVPRDLQSLVQNRDQLRQEVADLKVALNDPSGNGAVSQEKAQRLFFETLEKENIRLEAEVHALKSGLSNNGISDKLFSLSKEIAERDAVLKAWVRERRKVTEEIKVLTKVAAGDETTADDDRFFKKRELIVGEQEEHRLRHRRHMDELALKLDKAQRSTEAAERKASSLEQVVEEEQVADLVSSEYTIRLRQFESNAKRIAHLKNVVAAMESTYEPPAPATDYHDKRGLAEVEEAKQRVWQLLKMIRVKETVIAKNYHLTERPSFFCDPDDPSHFPSLGIIAKPPLPQVPLAPQPPKKAALESGLASKDSKKKKPLTARNAGKIIAAAAAAVIPPTTGETRSKPTSATNTRSTVAPRSASKTKPLQPAAAARAKPRPPRAVKASAAAESHDAAVPSEAPGESDISLPQAQQQSSCHTSRRSSAVSSRRSSAMSSRSQSRGSDHRRSKSQSSNATPQPDDADAVPSRSAAGPQNTSGGKDEEQYDEEFEDEPPQPPPAATLVTETGTEAVTSGRCSPGGDRVRSAGVTARETSGPPTVPAESAATAEAHGSPETLSPTAEPPKEEVPQWLDDDPEPSDGPSASEAPIAVKRDEGNDGRITPNDSAASIVAAPPPVQPDDSQCVITDTGAPSPPKEELPPWLADE